MVLETNKIAILPPQIVIRLWNWTFFLGVLVYRVGDFYVCEYMVLSCGCGYFAFASLIAEKCSGCGCNAVMETNKIAIVGCN